MKDSRARYTLLRFTFALSIITFIDRVCISTAAPAIRHDLGLSPVQMGWDTKGRLWVAAWPTMRLGADTWHCTSIRRH